MAANPNRLAGTVFLYVDGANYMLAGDFEYSVSGVQRETLVGMDRVHGFSVKPKQGHIAGTIRNWNGLSVAAVNAMENVTVVAQLTSGKTVVGRAMWTVDEQTVKSTDATLDVKWESADVSEQ
jgi:hypothetical protein